MKFFALGGKTLTFKELKLVFRSPLWFYLFTPINQPTPTTPFQSNWEVICSPCLPSSAPTQPFRKGYGVSLSLMQYLVWASAWYLSHCAVLQPQLLFFFFFFETSQNQHFSEVHPLLVLSFMFSSDILDHFFSQFLSTWLSCQDTVSSLVILQLFQLLRPQIFCGDGTVTSVFISRECIVCQSCHLTAFSDTKFSLAGQHHQLQAMALFMVLTCFAF